MEDAIAHIFEGACHRMPSRSFEGAIFCYRCSAMYTSLAIVGMLLIMKTAATHTSWKNLIIGVSLCLTMVCDVLLVRHDVYKSSIFVRIITGSLMGFGMATLFAGAFSQLKISFGITSPFVETRKRKSLILLFAVLAFALLKPITCLNLFASIGLLGGSSIVQGYLIYKLASCFSKKLSDKCFFVSLVLGLFVTLAELETLRMLPPGKRNVFIYFELMFS